MTDKNKTKDYKKQCFYFHTDCILAEVEGGEQGSSEMTNYSMTNNELINQIDQLFNSSPLLLFVKSPKIYTL